MIIGTCYGTTGCGLSWEYVSEAHCTACHRHFRNVTGFDDHRRDGECLDPASKGYIRVGHTWGTPEAHSEAVARRWRVKTIRQGQRGRSEDDGRQHD
jgi:hypothetical protein